MNAKEREPYLSAVDQALFPLGFKRRKKDLKWIRSAEPADTFWIHLNFGLAVINPSLGVRFTDLETVLPPEAGGRFGTARMLQSLSTRSYSSLETPPVQIANDILEFALPQLSKLQDRRAVIEILQSESPRDWTLLVDVSSRMRLLPLLLANLERISESLDWLTRFEIIAPERDQFIPKYDVFAEYFRKKYKA